MMNRLKTRIGSLALPNPIICGSGEPVMTEAGIRAALEAGAAGVIAKSVNEQPAAASQLDRADYTFVTADHRPAAAGVSLFCRSGLAQRDPAEWFEGLARLDRASARSSRFVAASIVLATADGAERIAALARTAGLRVLELNVGAPHASEASPGAIAQETDPDRLRALVSRVRAVTAGIQLWVKLSGLSTNLPVLTLAASQAGADAVVMMGRFMGLVPDLDTLAPALGTCAAYGGPWALPIVCRELALSRRALGPMAGERRSGVIRRAWRSNRATGRNPRAVPLLGTNGIRSGPDVARMALAGASATELLSVVMHEGFGALTRIINELNAWLTARELTFTDLIGRAADQLTTYAEQPAQPGRWRNYVPPETLD
jgi:dihydroorotate dehydrogenase